ncbi:type II toxin-antitoxin system death-on-curing family toxin [Furfurilactobacillus rossiae]|nr:type II toxin-antitoxin system death-on-curing family toxin [Furfurilactobacillus rossiae]MCF6165614.1 type II toxin-antitoxin system death-on-curing family toxin [Furfurilactobacillus rossiae]
MKYLTKAELIEINHYVVLQVGGTNYGVQSIASLDVIVKQPSQVIFGHELYPTIWLKAAFILQKITKKHVFVDGNKRTAIQAALYFLNLNGYSVQNLDLVNNADSFILAVTNSMDNEETMNSIAEWLEMICS